MATKLEVLFATDKQAARRFANRAGDGAVVSEYLTLCRLAKQVTPNSPPQDRIRHGKTKRSGGRSASLARKAARAERDRELRNRMRSPKGHKK